MSELSLQVTDAGCDDPAHLGRVLLQAFQLAPRGGGVWVLAVALALG